jgi:hypothetical protein
MINQVVNATVRVEIQYFMQNNNAANVMHAKYTGTIGLSDLDALAAVFVAWLNTEWAPLAASAWTANSITITDLGSLSGSRKSYPISPPTPGAIVADALAASSTIAIKEDLGHRGRGTSGRVFWVGLAESQAAGNTVGTTVMADILTALTTLNTNVTGLDAFLGLAVPHLVVNKIPVNPANSEVVVGFLATNDQIDSQKDRLPFHKKKKFPPHA